jgi:inner membrane transporter RhtA
VRRVTPSAAVMVLAATASVQSGAAVATRLFPEVGPRGTVLLRLALSAVLMLAVARPSLRGHGATDLGWAVAYGLVLAGMNTTFYEALSRIPLGVAVTVEFVGPLAVAVLGSRRPVDFVWAALAAAGVVLLSSVGGRLSGLGIVLALVAGGFWAAYILLAQRVGRVLPGTSGLAIALLVGTVAVLPIALPSAGTRLLHPGVIGRGALVALLSSAVPYSLELVALRRMRASVFGVLMSLEPAMGALSGLVFLGQHLRAREWVAVVLVMVASIGASTSGRRRPAMAEPGVPVDGDEVLVG